MFKSFLPLLPLAIMVLGAPGTPRAALAEKATDDKKERRLQVIEAGRTGELAPLETARHDPEPLVRRAAARALGRIGQPALPLLEGYAFDDRDALTRRIALRGALRQLPAAQQLAWLERAGNDASEWVRVSALEALAAIEPRSPEITTLLQAAQDDPSEEVSRRASQLLWPYHEEVASVRDRAEFRDLSLKSGQPLPLPEEGWKFQTDRTGVGHLEQWQSAGYDESSWKEIGIGKPWQAFGVQYQGIAWYRLRWKLPERPPADGVNLVFEAVDQSAWIWINGHYVGARDIGTAGWNQPFEVDVTDHLRWGEENVLTVRVSKPAGTHGGIWKPVYLDPLKR